MRFLLLFLFFFLLPTSHADVRFLSISDIHYGSNNTPGDGHDTNKILFHSALKKFAQLEKQVDFTITLGDFPTHMLMYSPKKDIYIKTVFHELYEANKAAKPMFFINGNNDCLRGNYQPFSQNKHSLLTLAPDWQGACIHCEGLTIDKTHMQDKGYYSSYVLPGNKDILLIALNSTPFSKISFLLPKYPNQDEDAKQQLKWLETQLLNHHAKQLLIAMHIPPGKTYQGDNYWQEPYLKEFIHLLNRAYPQYGQISLLTSHTHMDDIRKIRLNNGRNIYAYATPSISRAHHNNPAMKVFDLDTHMKLKDYTTYYTIKDDQWKNEHYNAIKKPNSIFSQCQHHDLAQCLDALKDKSVCDSLQEGQFYGVKSPRVDQSVCKLTYPVSH